ncbi:DUF6779 domain-containing protein [Mycobacterium spongiae]|uniref:DUF6779 domain-containing protein n=1 Tax=Mycobacterium spongiae TaxID=886343 RepID=A0A975PYS2_9MYCO|nr:DUF6779 domain-containing protein [Mycobacterium spongiae]QUR69179.1 hypothetical protein F6B93_20750 [Mycobacterium spongiae]
MTVLSRGARVRRGGRRPGWVLLTTLLVLAIGASSGLVFTNRVELLKLAVVLALWAAVAGAFVSMVYRRQADADRSRVHDLKLVYDLQLDREISARREYELSVESQLRRELASELRGQAADEVAALRAELTALRTSLEILFDTDLTHRPALGTLENEAATARALTDRARNGESPPADWVSSDRVASVRREPAGAVPDHSDDVAIIDVPEVGPDVGPEVAPEVAPFPQAEPVGPLGMVSREEQIGAPPSHVAPPVSSEEPLAPPNQPAHVRERLVEPGRPQPEAPPPPEPDSLAAPRHQRPPPRPEGSPWQPVSAEGQWLPPGTPGSHWASADAAPAAPPSGRRRRARHSSPEDQGAASLAYVQVAQHSDEPGRRSRSRHSVEARDYGPSSDRVPGDTQRPGVVEGARFDESPLPPGVPPPAGAPESLPPRLAPAPPPGPAPRHRTLEPAPDDGDSSSGSHGQEPQTGGQSVADLMARLQAEPSGGGRRRRRED